LLTERNTPLYGLTVKFEGSLLLGNITTNLFSGMSRILHTPGNSTPETRLPGCSTVELSPARSPQKGVQRRALALLPDGGSLHSAGQCREHGATQGNRGITPPKATVISVRLGAEEKAALDKYSADDRRPVSMMLRIIVADFLREKEYLK
jgi:hypothetical protein